MASLPTACPVCVPVCPAWPACWRHKRSSCAASSAWLRAASCSRVGAGSLFAKSSMKKLYPAVTDADSALRVAVEALYDAADDDSATGGPDLVRGIYLTAVLIEAGGASEVTEERVATLAREVISERERTDEFGPGRGPNNQAPRADS